MPIMWIRPKTYYQSGVTPFFLETSIGSQLVPQLADMQDAPIYLPEFNYDTQRFLQESIDSEVFGYKDRYQEYRSIPNRVVGEMRTTRTGWYIARVFNGIKIGAGVISQKLLTYSPWVITDNSKDHFFARVHHNMTLTEPLPMASRPWVW